MKRILQNKFLELLAAKARRENRTISQRQASRETKLTWNVVNNMAQNKDTSYLHRESIEILMEYLDVTHVEFFETVIVDEDEDEDEDAEPESKSPLLETT